MIMSIKLVNFLTANYRQCLHLKLHLDKAKFCLFSMVYICMYVCIYTYIHAHIYIYIYEDTHNCVCLCVHMYMYIKETVKTKDDLWVK
jgi:hypothetical protein